MNYYLKNKIQKLINETLEDKANEVMEKLKFNKPGSSFDYVEEGEMCESCGGEMTEGECSECGNMYEGEMCESCGGEMTEGECSECGSKGGEMMEDDEMDFKTPMRDAIRSHKGKFRTPMRDAIRSNKGRFKTPMRDAMAMRSRKDRHNDVEDDMNEVELDEKLYGNQKRIDKNHNGRLDSQDFKMLRKDKKEDVNENVFYELTTAVNGKREKLLFNESQFEEMIENIVLKEEGKFNKGKTPAGYAEYERSIKTSKKNEEGYMKDLSKKMKDYLKDGSKGKYEMSPKNFPKGNGELEEMSKKAYVASGAIEDYIDNFTAAGLENLDYDEIHPDEDWVTDNVVGSSRTGNNPEWANAVETPNNEKRNKIRKDNLLAKIKRKAYNKSPQPIVTDKSGENKGDKIMTKLESIDEKKKQKINEDFTRIMDLMSYKKNTQ
jgi:hypothetical protein